MHVFKSAITAGLCGVMISFPAWSVNNTDRADPLSQCYQSIGDAPRTALVVCLSDKLRVAEAALNKRIEQEKQTITALNSAVSQTAIASLDASQAAFITYRKAKCQYQHDITLGGSGAGDIMLACQVSLTESRLQQFRTK